MTPQTTIESALTPDARTAFRPLWTLQRGDVGNSFSLYTLTGAGTRRTPLTIVDSQTSPQVWHFHFSTAPSCFSQFLDTSVVQVLSTAFSAKTQPLGQSMEFVLSFLEPMVGIEPTTGSLQDCYSTTELHRLSSLRPNEFPRPAHYHPPHARHFRGWHSLALSERLAGLTGLGPATFGVTSRCSSHLRYNPIGGTVEESNSESASNRRSTLELLPTKTQAIGTEPQEKFPGAPPGTCFSAIQLSNITGSTPDHGGGT